MASRASSTSSAFRPDAAAHLVDLGSDALDLRVKQLFAMVFIGMRVRITKLRAQPIDGQRQHPFLVRRIFDCPEIHAGVDAGRVDRQHAIVNVANRPTPRLDQVLAAHRAGGLKFPVIALHQLRSPAVQQ